MGSNSHHIMNGAPARVWDDAAVRSLVEVPDCRTVLIVDDEFENLIVLEALLEDEGYTVLTADDGHEALALFEDRSDIDMVITDQRMPGMTGVELLAKVARLAPHSVRMVLSAYSDVSPIVSAVNDGAVYRFLLKPWGEEELLATVADGMQQRTDQLLLRRLVTALQERRQRLVGTLADLRRTHDQQLAAERLSTLGRLTSGITHDVNNHLGLIQGVLAEFEMQTDAEPLANAVHGAQNHVQSLVYLMRDVNAFARSKGLEVTRSVQPTVSFLSDTLGLFELEPDGEDRSRLVRVERDARLLFADHSRLRQALLALLRNAAQASTGIIRVAARRDAEHILIEVADDGIGMSDEVLTQAATPFFSAFEPTGLGIGLGIAKLVAEAHGGGLELKSTLGKGTVARLRVSCPSDLPQGGP